MRKSNLPSETNKAFTSIINVTVLLDLHFDVKFSYIREKQMFQAAACMRKFQFHLTEAILVGLGNARSSEKGFAKRKNILRLEKT